MHNETYAGLLSVNLETMRQRAAQALTNLAHAHTETEQDAAQIDPKALGERLLHYFSILASLEQPEQKRADILAGEFEQLADHGLQLLEALHDWAERLDCREAGDIIQSLCVTLALWCAQHQLTISHLEPIVNAFSRLANGTQDARILGEISDAIGVIIDATAHQVKQDLDKSNPGRPWRLLNLNHGIVATRSHDPKRMESVFEQLMFRLPGEAPGFFAEGMEQMDEIGYPAHVRSVMQKYYDLTNKPTLH